MSMNRIFDILDHLQENFGNKEVLAKRDASGHWKKYTVNEYVEHSYAIASALLELGLKRGDKVATIMQNRPEWNFLDMGITMAGLIHVPVYPTLNKADYSYILNHCDARCIVVGMENVYHRVEAAIPDLELHPEIFTIAPIEGRRSFSELLELGRQHIEERRPEIDEIKRSISPEDVGTLIYTSGTTGNPKGVLLRHKSMVINAAQVASMNTHDSSSRVLSFLPLCHVYERVCNYMYQILGGTIYYASSLSSIGQDLKDIHAMGFCAVPRVLEMMFDKLQAAGKDLKGIKKKIYMWAFRIAQVYDNEQTGWFYVKKYALADKLVYSKWRENLGGSPMIIVSGGSSIQERIIRLFTAAQLRVFEGYGLTETSPVISVNNPRNNELHPGTVGPVLPCVEFKLALDGEILTKGDCLMLGYYKDEEYTRKVIDEEGWFHTGDIGCLVNGYLKITDRKKEIFKLSTGKYIAPQVLENRLKESYFIEQAMVIGENEKIAAAIIVPNFDTLHFWCAKHQVHYANNEEIIRHPEVIKRIQKEITDINNTLPEHEQIRQFRLVAEVWSPQTGELSQTLKLCRAVPCFTRSTMPFAVRFITNNDLKTHINPTMTFTDLLEKDFFEKQDIVRLLAAEGTEMQQLLEKALSVKLQHLDNCVHLRGLIELSNICRKSCLYCGVRRDNAKVERYALTEDEVVECARLAHQLGYGSVAIQSGEREDDAFVEKITRIIHRIKEIDNGSLGITLSLGEQTPDVYRRWFEAGAHRYLLRIESSNEELYYKIHPRDERHDFHRRLRCIDSLLETGYQTGTGVMVGLPFQTLDILAEDLIFFRDKNVAMVGMGPFIPHPDTPLYQYADQIPSPEQRMNLTLKMIATLRLMMPEINMVAATANQTIDPLGREKAITAGANVIMPNLTPNQYREDYLIYPDKACVGDKPEQCANCLDLRMKAIRHKILYNAWGDSVAFTKNHPSR